MVAVWEGQDEALFETGRIGADKKKKQEILSKRETQNFSCVNLCSDRTMQQGLCTTLRLQNIQWARISFHK